MASEQEYQSLQDRIAALRAQVVGRLSSNLVQNPQTAEELIRQVDELFNSAVDSDMKAPPPPDKGLAELIGIGPEAAAALGKARLPQAVDRYDETVASERLIAVGDLYYIYQHERIGVFRVMQKLQELFRAGTVRLSGGPGAYSLYQFDRREVLRYTQRDRLSAYRRIFGYGNAPTPAGARANAEFHRMFGHFVNQVALFWRDKRISDVIRERATDPSFGSIAIVRRAGLDLRNNLKFTSFGHLNVLRVEVMQLLDEAFRILSSDDIKRLFGADNAWDVVEEVLIRYFNERLVTSPRQRMGVTGRDVLRWLAQPHINQTTRAQFEALLMQVAEPAEEWLTSAQSLGVAERRSNNRVMPWDVQAPPPRPRQANARPRPPITRAPRARPSRDGRPVPAGAPTGAAREYESEFESEQEFEV